MTLMKGYVLLTLDIVEVERMDRNLGFVRIVYRSSKKLRRPKKHLVDWD